MKDPQVIDVLVHASPDVSDLSKGRNLLTFQVVRFLKIHNWNFLPIPFSHVQSPPRWVISHSFVCLLPTERYHLHTNRTFCAVIVWFPCIYNQRFDKRSDSHPSRRHSPSIGMHTNSSVRLEPSLFRYSPQPQPPQGSTLHSSKGRGTSFSI